MNYIKITKNDIANGPGVRCVLWVAGCSLNCKGCHNKDAQSFKAGVLFDDYAKQELFDALDKQYIRGLTISGGHALERENFEATINLVREVKEMFPTKTFKTIINRSSHLQEAPMHGKSVLEFAFNSRGSKEYRALAKEIINNNTIVEG